MGWIGPRKRILDCLKTHADREEDGSFAVRNDEEVVSFLGAGEEYILPDNVEVKIDGEWKPLIPMLHGGLTVTVI